MDNFSVHSVVALLEDSPASGLKRGQVGVIVFRHQDDVFDVEFADNQGQTYALLTLRGGQILQLHHEKAA